jgi:hypothetical protein
VDGLRVDECKLGQSYVFSRARFALCGFYLCSAGTNGCTLPAASRLFPLGAPVLGEMAEEAGRSVENRARMAGAAADVGAFCARLSVSCCCLKVKTVGFYFCFSE